MSCEIRRRFVFAVFQGRGRSSRPSDLLVITCTRSQTPTTSLDPSQLAVDLLDAVPSYWVTSFVYNGDLGEDDNDDDAAPSNSTTGAAPCTGSPRPG